MHLSIYTFEVIQKDHDIISIQPDSKGFSKERNIEHNGVAQAQDHARIAFKVSTFWLRALRHPTGEVS